MADTPSLGDSYLNAIKGFEGYSPQASWDYAQYTNGYGTKAAHPGEKIDRDTAEQRFQSEIGNAASQVDKAFPQLPEGARAALTSLTFNAGPGWINGGLGNAVRQGDWGTASSMFRQYNHAGGQVLPGLTARRNQEAAWLTGAQGPQSGTTAGTPALTAQSLGAQGSPAGAPLFAGGPQGGNANMQLANLGMGMLQGSKPQAAPGTPTLPMMQPMQWTQFNSILPLLKGSA
jgi:lysozyme